MIIFIIDSKSATSNCAFIIFTGYIMFVVIHPKEIMPKEWTETDDIAGQQTKTQYNES